MSQALANINLGDTVVYQDELYTHVWHGGCLVSILYTDTGEECDCWNYCGRPESAQDAISKAEVRAQYILDEDSAVADLVGEDDE